MAYFNLNDINKNVESNVESFINEAESRFDRSVTELADRFSSDCDIVLLAGKGHETYQLIGDDKVPFSETEIVKSFFNN